MITAKMVEKTHGLIPDRHIGKLMFDWVETIAHEDPKLLETLCDLTSTRALLEEIRNKEIPYRGQNLQMTPAWRAWVRERAGLRNDLAKLLKLRLEKM